MRWRWSPIWKAKRPAITSAATLSDGISTAGGTFSLMMRVTAEATITTPRALRRKPVGTLTASWLPIRTPGIEPRRMFAASARSTLPPTQCATPRRPQQDGGVDDVGSDHPLRGQAENGDQDDGDQ